MRTHSIVVATMFVAAVAGADDAKEKALVVSASEALLSRGSEPGAPPDFAFGPKLVHVSPQSALEILRADLRDAANYCSVDTKLVKPVVAFAADHKSAWLAGMARREVGVCDGLGGNDELRVTVLSERGGRPVLLHMAQPISNKDQVKAVARGTSLPAVSAKIADDAADAVKVFEATFAVPKLLAASVSSRDDVVLFGSAGETVVGGKKVAATLQAWGLAFAVHGGIQAGATTSKTVAWAAANVDARPISKPTAKPTPYRVTAVYEKTEASWRLVQIQFSFVEP